MILSIISSALAIPLTVAIPVVENPVPPPPPPPPDPAMLISTISPTALILLPAPTKLLIVTPVPICDQPD